jgi:hypothetical protein
METDKSAAPSGTASLPGERQRDRDRDGAPACGKGCHDPGKDFSPTKAFDASPTPW